MRLLCVSTLLVLLGWAILGTETQLVADNSSRSSRDYPADVFAEKRSEYKEQALFTLKWGDGANQLGITKAFEKGGPGLIYAFEGLIVIPDTQNDRLLAYDDQGKLAWQIRGLPKTIDRVFQAKVCELYLGYQWNLYKVDVKAKKIETVSCKMPDWLEAPSAIANKRIFPLAVHLAPGGNLYLDLYDKTNYYTIECDRAGHYVRHYDVIRPMDPSDFGLNAVREIRTVGDHSEIVISSYDFQDDSESGVTTVLRLPVKLNAMCGSPMRDDQGNYYVLATTSEGSAVYKFNQNGKWVATLGGNYLTSINVESNRAGSVPVSVSDRGDVYILVTDPANGVTVVKYECSEIETPSPIPNSSKKGAQQRRN